MLLLSGYLRTQMYGKKTQAITIQSETNFSRNSSFDKIFQQFFIQ